jgi:hypothetical protein
MRAGDQDQHDENCVGRQCIAQQGNRHVSTRKLHNADLAQLRAEREGIDAFERQAGENADSIAQVLERAGERRFFLKIGSFNAGRIFNAPMRRHRVTWPDGASFTGRVVAGREHEIHFRRIRRVRPSFTMESTKLI